MSGLPLVPVSCPSLCTQDKHLEVQLQATSKLVVSSLKFFFFIWMQVGGDGVEKKIQG